MTTVRELLESCRNIDKTDYFASVSKRTRERQRVTGLVESKDLELQTTPRLVQQTSRVREELPTTKGDKALLSAQIKVLLERETEVFGVGDDKWFYCAFPSDGKASCCRDPKVSAKYARGYCSVGIST